MCPNLKIWSEKKPLYGFLPILYLFHMIELSNLTSGGAVFFFVFFSNISVMTDGIDYIQHFNKQEVHIVLHLRLNIYIKQYLFFFFSILPRNSSKQSHRKSGKVNLSLLFTNRHTEYGKYEKLWASAVHNRLKPEMVPAQKHTKYHLIVKISQKISVEY